MNGLKIIDSLKFMNNWYSLVALVLIKIRHFIIKVKEVRKSDVLIRVNIHSMQMVGDAF